MIWLSWRQFRAQAVVAAGALTVIAAALAVTGPTLSRIYFTSIATCGTRGDCATVTSAFLARYPLLQTLGVVLVVVPGFIGLFWGAPLVARELETGTFRLVWTQSTSRTRWLVVRLTLVGLASAAAAGLLSLMVTWWSSPLDRVTADRFSPGAFGERGLAPVGYAAFAFALGVTAGVLTRRTLPAMASSLVGFVAVRLAITQWIRPHLAVPVRQAFTLDPLSTGWGSTGLGPPTLQVAPPSIPNAWILSTDIVDKAGHTLTPDFLVAACPTVNAITAAPPRAGGNGQVPQEVKEAVQGCLAKVSETFHGQVTFQPASRYWLFQAGETAIFLALALALAGLCVWWVRRRLT